MTGDETVSLPAGGHQPTRASQVVGLHLCLAVAGSVVLMDALGSVDPEIGAGDKASPIIEDRVLRRHRDLSRDDVAQVIITAEVVRDSVLPTLVPREKLPKRERRDKSA